MNRRNFFKTTALGVGATVLAPTITLGATTELPLYKQFDWLPSPVSLLYRLNEITETEDRYMEVEYMPVAVKTQKLRVVSDVNVDYTLEQVVEPAEYWILGGALNRSVKYNQLYYTNPLLLNEAKKAGFTHLYMFASSIQFDKPLHYRNYFVRGVKMPEWKSVDGKIPGIKINRNKQ